MSDRTNIEWSDATWNPVTGCDKISLGCDNCYAWSLARRLKAMGVARYQKDGDPQTSGPGFGLTLHPDLLDMPRSWRKPRSVFVNSMSDLFHNDIPSEFIQQVFGVMSETPRHTYKVLTKRSKRLATLAPELPWPDNVWMGVTVETAHYMYRIKHLRQTEAAVRFICAEPLLGPLPDLPLDGIHWLIAGGESGSGYRPVEEEWLLDIRDQCQKSDVAFLFKQWGGVHSKAGGRTLDGQLHDEMPVTVGRRTLFQ